MKTDTFIRWMLENCGSFTLETWTEWTVTGHFDRYYTQPFQDQLEDAFGTHIDITVRDNLPHMDQGYTRLSFIYRR